MKKKKDIKTIPLKPELTQAEIENAETLDKIESWKIYCNHLQDIADNVAKKLKASKIKLEIIKLENELFRLKTEIEAKTRFYMHYIQRVSEAEEIKL